ncbi:unnamed protein product [Adineta steineri]|uniref:G-protein coupled receptors family 1 profile domain-containing protein n=1 Tax=Adineta steineri TaxID=433720 RepID=A0A818HAI6_9BILA|nr:unnamed protein product [Adineta steineri]
MRVIAIFDILMLYGWNLDHYLSAIHGFAIQTSSIPSCRLLSFLNYFAAQSSSWLRVFACLDRYLALSCSHRIWLCYSKNVLIIILSTISIITLLNLHFIICGCSYRLNGSISVQSWLFQTYPLWDYVNLGVYNCVPFILMITLDMGVIYHLFHLRHINIFRNLSIQHRPISTTLLITTFLFLIMTVPSTVAFAFFSTADSTLLYCLDGLLYSYHVLSFPIYMITLAAFRRRCIKMITCRKNQRKIVPHIQIQHKK